MNTEVRNVVATIVANDHFYHVPSIESAVDRVSLILEEENCNEQTLQNKAIEVRNILWNSINSNFSATQVTMHIYAALGRSNECKLTI